MGQFTLHRGQQTTGTSERLSYLEQVPVFGGLNADSLLFLCEKASVVVVPKGQFFFREGEEGSSMLVLEHGKVGLFKRREGREYLLGYLHPGDCFGEMALIDLFPRSASVLALEDCSGMELSAALLYRLYEHAVEQFAIFYMNIARELSRRLRKADNRCVGVTNQNRPGKESDSFLTESVSGQRRRASVQGPTAGPHRNLCPER